PLGTDRMPADEMSIEQARSLGAALSGPAGGEPMTAEEIEWLGMAVAKIGASADLVAAFLPAMTTTGWTAVCNQLGTARQQLVTEATMYGGEITATEAAGWAAIDTVFAGLGAIVVRDRSTHPESDASLLLDDMTAYSAALLVQQLDLDGPALARVSRELIEREQLEPAPYDSVHLGPRAADLLFDTMLATGAAPTAYVMLTLDAPELAYAVTDDQDLADRLVLAGTDIAAMHPAEASVAIPALARWLLKASSDYRPIDYKGQPAVALAQLIVPYLLPVLRSEPEGFGLSDAERKRVQMVIIEDDDALQLLFDERDRIAAGLAIPSASDAASRIAAIRDVAQLLAFVDTMRRKRDVQRVEHAQAEWDLMWTLVSGLVGLIPVPAVVSAASGVATTGLRSVLENAGVGPQSMDSVRSETLQSFDTMTTIASAILLCSTFDGMVATGQLAPGTKPPPLLDLSVDHPGSTYDHAVFTWLQGSGFDGGVFAELWQSQQEIHNSHETASNENCILIDC
ncbi:MAG: hypothetical protein JWN39_1985, partial [Ilumatobacteraceae bacterium]|nr:hypothetical protein [Ilumatobacteraceae bacterium]